MCQRKTYFWLLIIALVVGGVGVVAWTLRSIDNYDGIRWFSDASEVWGSAGTSPHSVPHRSHDVGVGRFLIGGVCAEAPTTFHCIGSGRRR
jgi:hypothetical protein